MVRSKPSKARLFGFFLASLCSTHSSLQGMQQDRLWNVGLMTHSQIRVLPWRGGQEKVRERGRDCFLRSAFESWSASTLEQKTITRGIGVMSWEPWIYNHNVTNGLGQTPGISALTGWLPSKGTTSEAAKILPDQVTQMSCPSGLSSSLWLRIIHPFHTAKRAVSIFLKGSCGLSYIWATF